MPKTRRCFAVLALPLTVALAAAQQPSSAADSGDWPGFRGPARDGVARAKPPLEWGDTENLTWRVELPGPGSSSPIVLGDRVYVACYSGYGAHLDDGGDPEKLVHHLVCVDRANGELLWDTAVPGPLAAAARQVQLSEHGFASPTPITDGESIYAYFGRAGVAAISLEGEVLWQADLGVPNPDAKAPTNSVERGGQVIPLRWGSAASPLLYENLVIVNCSEESNSIRALDKASGDLVWKRESSNLEGSAISPMVVENGDESVLVIALGGEVWGLEPASGDLIWSIETGTRGGMSPTPVADAALVYVFGGEGKSHAIRFARAAAVDADGNEADRVAWTGENVGIPSPVLHDGKLFLVETNGTASCLDAKDGKTLFTGRLDGRTSSIYASPVLADGRLYVVSRKRGTFVYSADGKFELLARNELTDDSQFNASPAMVGDEVYLRSDKFLYRLGGQ